MTLRISKMGGGAVEAELVEDLGNGKARVRLAGKSGTSVVKTSRIAGWRGSAAAPAEKAREPRKPALPPMMRASDLLRPSVPFTPGAGEACPKPLPPARSDRYLKFVRTKPCLLCDQPAPSHAHHHGPHAMSEKTDDYRCIPLCDLDHRAFHDGNRPHLEELVAPAQRELLVEYVRALEGT